MKKNNQKDDKERNWEKRKQINNRQIKDLKKRKTIRKCNNK